MLKYLVLPVFLFLSALSNAALSQEICTTDTSGKILYSRGTYLRYADIPPPATPRAVEAEENRLGYYGFKHPWLHSNGVIEELRSKTGSSCCDNPFGGECRIAVVDMVSRRVQIDGMNCPITEGIKFAGLSNVPQGFGVVCASKIAGQGYCPAIYCLGTNGGF